MFPQLDTAAKNTLSSWSKNFLIWQIPVEANPGDCPNCGGVGVLAFRATKSNVYKTASLGKLCFYDGEHNGWRVVEETLVFPCTVCNEPKDWSALLFRGSGLQIEEYAWDIDYIRGMRGKERLYSEFSTAISRFPITAGYGIVAGSYGLGKTGALKSLVAAACRAGITAKYLTAEKLLTMIRATFDTQQSEAALIDRLVATKILVIDEVDVIGNSAWAEATIRMIVDERYAARNKTMTWFATNNLDGLWPYLRSRLSDGMTIPVSGDSLRGPTAPRPGTRDEDIFDDWTR